MRLQDIANEIHNLGTVKPRFLDGKNGHVYYLRITYQDIVYYKIGVTAKLTQARVKTLYPVEGVRIDVIDSTYCDTLLAAYTVERYLHRRHKEHRFKHVYEQHGKKFLGSGMNELYVIDSGASLPRLQLRY